LIASVLSHPKSRTHKGNDLHRAMDSASVYLLRELDAEVPDTNNSL
jgi:hypothetical protein